MYTITSAVVIGARHARMGRNGQDAVATIVDSDVAVAVACDGCGSGANSEVGARLGARMFAEAIARRLRRGDRVDDELSWSTARIDVAAALAELLERMGGDREVALREHLLFTIVACAMTRDGAAVWALGDGAYAIDRVHHVLGPFEGNAPPYLAYDLVGDPRIAHFEACNEAQSIAVATDGIEELSLVELASPSSISDRTPDALRRKLVLLARGAEKIDWDARRVVRTPAVLQDDCAVCVIRRAA